MLVLWVVWKFLLEMHLAGYSVESEISVVVLPVLTVRWTAGEGAAISICSSQTLSVHGKLVAAEELVVELRAGSGVNSLNLLNGRDVGLHTYNIAVVSSNDLLKS